MVILIIVLKIILYTFSAFIIALGLFLTLPFHYDGEMMLVEGVIGNFTFGWPWRVFTVKGNVEKNVSSFGLYFMNYKLLSFQESSKKVKEEVKEKEKVVKEKIERVERRKGITTKELLERSFLNEIFGYLRRIFRILKPKNLYLKGVYGFEDPAVTGMASGVISIAKSCFPKANIHLEPTFYDEVLILDFKAKGSVVLAPLLYQTLRTILREPVRKIVFKKKK